MTGRGTKDTDASRPRASAAEHEELDLAGSAASPRHGSTPRAAEFLQRHAPLGLGGTTSLATVAWSQSGWLGFGVGLVTWLAAASARQLRDPSATADWFVSLFEALTRVVESWRRERPRWRRRTKPDADGDDAPPPDA